MAESNAQLDGRYSDAAGSAVHQQRLGSAALAQRPALEYCTPYCEKGFRKACRADHIDSFGHWKTLTNGNSGVLPRNYGRLK